MSDHVTGPPKVRAGPGLRVVSLGKRSPRRGPLGEALEETPGGPAGGTPEETPEAAGPRGGGGVGG